MKKSLLLTLLIINTLVQGQTLPVQTKTLPSTHSVDGKNSSANTQNLVLNLRQDTCIDKKFSIVFYLINDSAYALTTASTSAAAIGTYSLSEIMTLLNKTFKPICVQFEHCKTVIVPDYPANEWKKSGNGADVIRNYYEKNVINIYLPDGIIPPYDDTPEESYTFTLPTSPPSAYTPTDAIVLAKGAVLLPLIDGGLAGSTLLHVFGHYFGLPHTYIEKNPGSIPNPPPPTNATPPISTLEYVDHANIQNCLDHGDGFCDTEADPYPAAPNSTLHPVGTIFKCGDAGGLKDGHGDFYIPPYDNIMSHYVCRCKFSQQQLRYMAYYIITRRLYLH